VLAKDSSFKKRKMALSETGEISYSPVVKVNVCNTILLIKGWRMNAILFPEPLIGYIFKLYQ
jgi:hypothetical protein